MRPLESDAILCEQLSERVKQQMRNARIKIKTPRGGVARILREGCYYRLTRAQSAQFLAAQRQHFVARKPHLLLMTL